LGGCPLNWKRKVHYEIKNTLAIHLLKHCPGYPDHKCLQRHPSIRTNHKARRKMA
jgi:hypothetical protein